MPMTPEKKVVMSHGKLAFGAMTLVVVSVVFTSVAGAGGILRGNLTFFGGGSIPSSGFNDAAFYSSYMQSMSAAMQSAFNSSFSSNATSYSMPWSSSAYSSYSYSSYSMPYSSSSMSSFSSSSYSMPYSSSSMSSYSSSAYSMPWSSSSMSSFSSSSYSMPYSSSSMSAYSSSSYSMPYSSSSMSSFSSSSYSMPYSSSSMSSYSSSAYSMPWSSSSMSSFSSSSYSMPYSSSSMSAYSSSSYSMPYSSSSMSSFSSSSYSMPYSSSSMANYSSAAASVPYAPLMSAIASSMNAQMAEEVSPALRSEAMLAIEDMAPIPAELAERLTTQLTLTPQVATQVFQFIAADLPTMPMTQQVASVMFKSFKLNNGEELKAANLTPAIDVDPKDWYAPVVVEVQMLGIMQGSPVTGLFEPERLMNQAEFAKTLANAATKVEEAPLRAAAPVSGAFDRYPAWAMQAIAVLKSHDIPTTFFRAEPTESVTRLQLAQGIATVLFADEEVNTASAKYFKDINAIPMTLRDTVRTVSALGIMTGDGTTGNFEPYRFANRAEVAKVFATALRIKALQMSADAR